VETQPYGFLKSAVDESEWYFEASAALSPGNEFSVAAGWEGGWLRMVLDEEKSNHTGHPLSSPQPSHTTDYVFQLLYSGNNVLCTKVYSCHVCIFISLLLNSRTKCASYCFFCVLISGIISLTPYICIYTLHTFPGKCLIKIYLHKSLKLNNTFN
jgi:hypothetical protein